MVFSGLSLWWFDLFLLWFAEFMNSPYLASACLLLPFSCDSQWTQTLTWFCQAEYIGVHTCSLCAVKFHFCVKYWCGDITIVSERCCFMEDCGELIASCYWPKEAASLESSSAAWPIQTFQSSDLKNSVIPILVFLREKSREIFIRVSKTVVLLQCQTGRPDVGSKYKEIDGDQLTVWQQLSSQ